MMATRYDEVPEFGGFTKNGPEMPSWSEVICLLKGERPPEITEDKWKEKNLEIFTIKYMIPKIDETSQELSIESEEYEAVKICDKDRIKEAFIDVYLHILEVINNKKLKTTDQRKLAINITQVLKIAQERTSSDKKLGKNYVVNFTQLETECKVVTCILRSCAAKLAVIGSSEEKERARKFVNDDSAIKILNFQGHEYIPNPSEDPDLYNHRMVTAPKLVQVARLVIPEDNKLYKTKGNSKDIEMIMENLNKLHIQKENESNEAYVARVIEERTQYTEEALAKSTYTQLAQHIEISDFLREKIAEQGDLKGADKTNKALILEKIDELYLEGRGSITNDNVKFVEKYIRNAMDLEQR